MLANKKTYITAIGSAVAALAAAYFGVIDWTTAFQFIQASALGAFIRNGIGNAKA